MRDKSSSDINSYLGALLDFQSIAGTWIRPPTDSHTVIREKRAEVGIGRVHSQKLQMTSREAVSITETVPEATAKLTQPWERC